VLAESLSHRRAFRKYGRDTVRLAGANLKGRWRTKAAKRSPRYTTKLAVPLIS
jgi:hypothetical protein